MPKLLQINTSLNCNSTGKIAEQIGLLAKSQGWDCYIAHGPRYVKESSLYSYQVGSNIDEKIHLFNSLFLDGHGLSSTSATKKFVNWINTIHPDIIHLHNIHGYYLNFQVLFDYLEHINIPIIWTLHDCWSMTGHCSFFEGVGCNRWKIGCGKCIYKTDYPRSLFLDRSRHNYLLKRKAFTSLSNMTIVPVSDWLGSIVKESYLCKYPIRVIHNGTDLDIFKPLPIGNRYIYAKAEQKIVLGVASIWHERKGLNDFIELSKDSSLKVILVGVNDKLKTNLPESIIGITRTNNQKELAELYSIADVFVNPTYDDNFPTTNIEALACGTPVITYRTGGSPEAIDSSTGIVVEKGRLSSLKEAIRTITSCGKEIYRDTCRQRAIKLFNKDDRFQDYIQLYNELLNEKGITR